LGCLHYQETLMGIQEEMFRRWVRDHRGILMKVTRAYAWTPQDQEDLSQEILLQWWRSIPGFRRDASESTWVYRVALNTAMTWRRQSRDGKGVGQTVPESLPCPKPPPDDAAADHELLDWLYSEIATWPLLDRSLMLLYLDGVSYRDAAEILGISETNVGVKLNRIKKRLVEKGKESDGH
jgi:RNA polymerase sigma-70 factor (ECF subfamily)